MIPRVQDEHVTGAVDSDSRWTLKPIEWICTRTRSNDAASIHPRGDFIFITISCVDVLLRVDMNPQGTLRHFKTVIEVLRTKSPYQYPSEFFI